MKSFIKKLNIKEEIRDLKSTSLQVEINIPQSTNLNNNRTMFSEFELSWNGAFMFLLWISGASLLIIFMMFLVSPKTTQKYTLGTINGKISITKEMNWSIDEEIELDRTITYEHAIKMIDSLNKTLK